MADTFQCQWAMHLGISSVVDIVEVLRLKFTLVGLCCLNGLDLNDIKDVQKKVVHEKSSQGKGNDIT